MLGRKTPGSDPSTVAGRLLTGADDEAGGGQKDSSVGAIAETLGAGS